MLLVDRILLAPVFGVIWVADKIRRAAEDAVVDEKEEIHNTLRELYMQLETGSLSDEEFDKEEARLLDRLDELEEAEEEMGIEAEDEGEKPG